MFAIVDCNAFYCSCEKVFRPELEGKPVVVLSNNDGCIIARTDEARALGVDMSGPYFLARPLIEQYEVAVFSSNYNLYGDLSRRVMEVLRTLAGEAAVEVYSVDEAFVALPPLSADALEALAVQLRDTIYQWTGIRVSIGIAPTKTLSKLANRLAKKNKRATGCIRVLSTPEAIAAALEATPVREVWGIGTRYADKLDTWGFSSAADLRAVTEEWARAHLGGVVGARLVRELNGEDSLPLQDPLLTKKMIATTRMFGHMVTEFSDIREAVATYAGRAAEKLRRQGSAASVVSVFLVAHEKADGPRFTQGPTVQAQTILPVPASSTPVLVKAAGDLAATLYRSGKKYKKAGVVLSGLVPDDAVQGNLFEEGRSVGRYLMELMDNINFSMRGDVVKVAATGTKQDWKMRRHFHSPRYTTRWEELYTVS
ncbi:MAG TPA: Y-family DNA polymerase [Chitinophagaceae bacterium]|nr:Y-family DNA polymerase [Chitinophagaceae bacterium]